MSSLSAGPTPDISYINASLAALVDERLMGVPGFSIDQLMELAGYSVACAVSNYHQRLSPAPSRDILLFCGPGNNGGDGLVAARHLFHFGYLPTVVYPKQAQGALFSNLLQQMHDLDIPVLTTTPANTSKFGLLVDSLFGFSFKGPSREPYSSMIALFQSSPSPVVAVDIPSGWEVDAGDVHLTGYSPQAVVSLTAPKLCMRGYPGVHYVGGRFVPPALAKELGLVLPDYGLGDKQFVEIAAPECADTNTGSTEITAMFVTASSQEEAKVLSSALIVRKLAACVTILPQAESVYEWEGEVRSSQELLLMIKTRKSLVNAVTEAVKQLHSYDVPESIALDVSGGSAEYLQWVRDSTEKGDSR
ncbi:YjeF N-terminal domain-containing protein [Ochromonadaceae sp. CCMP2298]|nr:YjeF N-terminal domain-containing protein [Ochromonadaceae sp. CCMP2298]